MRPKFLLLPAAILLAPFALASAANAGAGCDGASVVAHIFDEADADGDGRLTEAEYEAASLGRFGVSFEQSDLDGDGATSFDEYLDLYEAHHPPFHGNEV